MERQLFYANRMSKTACCVGYIFDEPVKHTLLFLILPPKLSSIRTLEEYRVEDWKASIRIRCLQYAVETEAKPSK
jgi:hypothetical protein